MSIIKYKITAFLKFMQESFLSDSMPAISQTHSDKHEVVTQITIKSSPDKVWDMLTNFEKYPDWHPYIKKIEGKPDKKTKIKVTYKKYDNIDGHFSAYIIDNDPDKIFSWGGSLYFIFRAKHYFIIETINSNSVRLIQGEYWRGIFGGMYGKNIYADTTRKFELMNNKLKQVLENKSVAL